MRHVGKRITLIMGKAAKLKANTIVEKEYLYSDKICYHKADKDRGLIERGRSIDLVGV